MPTLQLTQHSEGDGRYRVEAALEGDGLPLQTAASRFAFGLTAQDRETLRWYLEDYPEAPRAPASQIARSVEQRMVKIGATLFRRLFQSGDAARGLWATLRLRLRDTRIEIVTGAQEPDAIPWELLRDPKTDTPLALSVQSFVRACSNPARRPELPAVSSGPLRILFVLCRPAGSRDVPFHSVVIRLIKALGARDEFQLNALRPPTFAQLGRTLRQAQREGRPYHVVHFEGYGVSGESAPGGVTFSRLRHQRALQGRRGYLLFEQPRPADDLERVDGPTLGKLLAETCVPILLLSVCRSTHAEAPTAPRQIGQEADDPPTPDDPPEQARAFGALAQAVMDAGAAGVVAMPYHTSVMTAAPFVADLFAALAQGQTLGEAATQRRRQLHAPPSRNVAEAALAALDWSLPLVYEAAPLLLFPRQAEAAPLRMNLTAAQASPARGDLDPTFPRPPDAGFFGRDETLVALERAFDTRRVVLLHGLAGSGKTAMATEFARWSTLSGGAPGPVQYTAFTRKPPLATVLDKIEQVFGSALEQSGVRWQTLDDEERLGTALQILSQVPVLWLWDNVAPALESARAEEKEALAVFLRDAQQTQAKLLLISRGDEHRWLGDLPTRLEMPPMPMRERLALTRALAEKRPQRLSEARGQPETLASSLAYTQGNPLTLTTLAGQIACYGLKTDAQVESFVARLREGEPAFAEGSVQGRSPSLDAALSYGLEHACTAEARARLALLHLFQNFVNVDTLCVMGHPEAEWCLPAVRGLTREEGLSCLDRAAEIGLLTALGGGFYTLPPALSWHWKRLFEHGYPATPSSNEGASASQAVHAFVGAMGYFGNHYHRLAAQGNRDVIGLLTAEEDNLLQARDLARGLGLWRQVISTMQGLRALYGHTGQRAAWKRLVEEIAPEFVAPTTGSPLPGREEKWDIVTDYLREIDRAARQLAEAERVQRALAEQYRQRAAEALALPPETWNPAQRTAVQLLSVALQQLGLIRLRQGQAECETLFQEAFDLVLRVGDRTAASVFAFHLGDAYVNVPERRSMAQAAQWYRRSLESCGNYQYHGRAKCLGQLGKVAYEQFLAARAAHQPEPEQFRYLNEALRCYTDGLALLPPHALNDLAVMHHALGALLDIAGDVERALTHYRESLHSSEAGGDLHGAADTRYNIANLLQWAGRTDEALLYAQAALHNFETVGDRPAEMQRTQALIAELSAGSHPPG
jgi:tetratricopeptide (TPR) repeat protein